jgi:hypothetical protein
VIISRFTNIFKIIIVFLFVAVIPAKSLTPFWYSWYALDSVGQLLPNESGTLNVRIAILEGNTVSYQELHTGVSTDQFAIFSLEVGTGTVESGNLSSIITAADVRIRAEVQKSPGPFVLVTVVGLSSVQVNNIVLPGNIPLPQDEILIGDASGNAEAQPVGGDLSATNTGTAAAFTIGAGAVTEVKIADNAVTTAKIADANVTYPKLQNASNPNRVIVSNGPGNTWVESTVSALETDPKVGTLTANYVPHWGTTTLVDGSLTDNGTIVTALNDFQVNGSVTLGDGSADVVVINGGLTINNLANATDVNVVTVDAAGLVHKRDITYLLALTSIIDINSDYTATENNGTILVDASSGDVTVTIPAANSVKGLKYSIKKVDVSNNKVIIQPLAGTIDGQSNRFTDVPWQGFVIQSNGVNWFVVGIF